ncbi:hypothetical protein BGX29_001444 [Mortierella sp. GBA35]|nr:hypothetical protein BGX29_001444 [Mortierella sp. GBA35]
MVDRVRSGVAATVDNEMSQGWCVLDLREVVCLQLTLLQSPLANSWKDGGVGVIEFIFEVCVGGSHVVERNDGAIRGRGSVVRVGAGHLCVWCGTFLSVPIAENCCFREARQKRVHRLDWDSLPAVLALRVVVVVGIDYGCAKMNEAVQGKSSLGIEGLNLDHPDLDRGEKTCMREDKGKDGPGKFLIETGAVVLRANGGVTAPLKLTN